MDEYRESTHARQWGLGWGPKVIRSIGHRRFAGPVRRLIVRLDRIMYRLTRGSYLMAAMVRIPALTLLVTTPKAATAVVPLQYVVVDSAVYVLGTNWGQPKHPRWTDWLIRNNRCAVNIKGDHRDAVAELIDDETRVKLWPRIVDVSAYYARCQRISGRQLRIFRLRFEN